MQPAFYNDHEYRRKQGENTRKWWKEGKYKSKIKPFEKRYCKRIKCQQIFLAKHHDKKLYCSSRCAALVNSPLRKTSLETRQRISLALKGKPNPYKGSIKIPRIAMICHNINCKKVVMLPPYLAKTQKYCSNACVISVVGRLTTSPKAAKSKPGIRLDIDPSLCFYSTWEANIARVFTLVGIEWVYAPTIFDLGSHTYRPDFYLPNDDVYIEVKNFMGSYSLERDMLFRDIYFHIKLEILGKKEYKEIEYYYRPLIDTWEK